MSNNGHMHEHDNHAGGRIEVANSGRASVDAYAEPLLEIGILTIGKPTLSMALSSLLLQDERRISIHIVDTAPVPIINRIEVQCVLRLATEREIRCTYEHIHDDKRAFSAGRLALLEALRGPNICFMDDDVVMPSQALATMMRFFEQNPVYGWLAPYCKNAGTVRTALSGRPHYSPGGVFHQDAIVRNILLEYYETAVDVLDKQRASNKVWEIAFLTEIFPMLGRATHVQNENIIYHLDYHERPNWNLLREDLVRTSRDKAAELVAKYGEASFTEVKGKT